MSRSKRLAKSVVLSGGVLIGASVVLTASLPAITTYAHNRADGYAHQAKTERDQANAISDYRLALVLDPGNVRYRIELAEIYQSSGDISSAVHVLGDSDAERLKKAAFQIQLGKSDDAIHTLKPVSSALARVERSQALLEQQSYDGAIQAIQAPTDDSGRFQSGLSSAVSGDSAAARGQAAAMSDIRLRERLERASGSYLVLAQELYAQHLYRSARHVLESSKESSGERSLLLSHVLLEMQPRTDERVQAAKDAAGEGIKRDPSNIRLHQVMRDIDTAQEDSSGANQESEIIRRLQTGEL